MVAVQNLNLSMIPSLVTLEDNSLQVLNFFPPKR